MEETLKYLFASLQNIIPDVMEACSNDGEAAFEKLQRMQAGFHSFPQIVIYLNITTTSTWVGKASSELFQDDLSGMLLPGENNFCWTLVP